MKTYKIGLSIKGFLAFIAVMIPNIVWMIYPPSNNMLSSNSSNIAILNILMSVSQWTMIATLIFLSRTIESNKKYDKLYIVTSIICLSIYYISWVYYYMNIVPAFILLGMAIFPCGFFILFTIWQNNTIAFIFAIMFSVLHIAITYSNVIII